MWKKVVVSLFSIMLIFSFFTMGSIASANKYEVNVPAAKSSATKENVALVSGKAPDGTEVLIKVYGTTDLKGKKYTLNNLPRDNQYILISRQAVRSGRLGFAKEINLVNGINKVVVSFRVKGSAPVEQRIIYVYDRATAENIARNPRLLNTPNK